MDFQTKTLGKWSKNHRNKCSHCAFRPILIGKHAHRKGNINHVRTWSQAISNNFSCLFRLKIAKIAKDKCAHCAMDIDYCFWWLSTAPLHRFTHCGYTPSERINFSAGHITRVVLVVKFRFGTVLLPTWRGVPTERRRPCDCTYWCIEWVCRSVGTLNLCDFC